MNDKLDILLEKVAIVGNDMTHVRAKVDAMDNKVQHLNDKSIVTEQSVDSAHKRIDELFPIVARHEKTIVEGQGAAKGASYVWSMVSGFGGAVLGILGSWLLGK